MKTRAIRIYDRYLSKGRAYTDEIMLHELAHGLDHATEGYTERSNVHDERFVIAARTLGANISRYLKDNKEKMVEKALEKKRMQSYIPPEFQNIPDDRNNCSLIFYISKRPTIICRSCFLMTLTFADIYGDWQKDYGSSGGKYVMCGLGTYERLKFSEEIFTELETAVRKISRKSKQTFPLDNKGGIVLGIKYGFVSSLKEQGFKQAIAFDFSAVDRMKNARENNNDGLAICDHPLWPISIEDFWNGFDEGRVLALNMTRSKRET